MWKLRIIISLVGVKVTWFLPTSEINRLQHYRCLLRKYWSERVCKKNAEMHWRCFELIGAHLAQGAWISNHGSVKTLCTDCVTEEGRAWPTGSKWRRWPKNASDHYGCCSPWLLALSIERYGYGVGRIGGTWKGAHSKCRQRWTRQTFCTSMKISRSRSQSTCIPRALHTSSKISNMFEAQYTEWMGKSTQYVISATECIWQDRENILLVYYGSKD